MQELLDQLITPEVRMVLYLMVVCVVMLYVLSIVYVIRDAQRRGAEPWWMWAIISVIPIVGLLAYVILRPSSYLIDREEQDLDAAAREGRPLILLVGTWVNHPLRDRVLEWAKSTDKDGRPRGQCFCLFGRPGK